MRKGLVRRQASILNRVRQCGAHIEKCELTKIDTKPHPSTQLPQYYSLLRTLPAELRIIG